MKTITLTAIYDGERLQIEGDYPLPTNTPLIVTFPDPASEDAEKAFRDDWSALAMQGLARAYGPDEPEFTEDMIVEPNPLYDPR